MIGYMPKKLLIFLAMAPCILYGMEVGEEEPTKVDSEATRIDRQNILTVLEDAYNSQLQKDLQFLCEHALEDCFLFTIVLKFFEGKNTNRIIKTIIQKGAAQLTVYRNACFEALTYNDIKLLNWLQDRGFDVIGCKYAFGESGAHIAASWDNVIVLEWLYLHGADFNARDSEGVKPFDRAARRGATNAMEWFFRHTTQRAISHDSLDNILSGLENGIYVCLWKKGTQLHSPLIPLLWLFEHAALLTDRQDLNARLGSILQRWPFSGVLFHDSATLLGLVRNLKPDKDTQCFNHIFLFLAGRGENFVEIVLEKKIVISIQLLRFALETALARGKRQVFEVLFTHLRSRLLPSNEMVGESDDSEQCKFLTRELLYLSVIRDSPEIMDYLLSFTPHLRENIECVLDRLNYLVATFQHEPAVIERLIGVRGRLIDILVSSLDNELDEEQKVKKGIFRVLFPNATEDVRDLPSELWRIMMHKAYSL